MEPVIMIFLLSVPSQRYCYDYKYPSNTISDDEKSYLVRKALLIENAISVIGILQSSALNPNSVPLLQGEIENQIHELG